MNLKLFTTNAKRILKWMYRQIKHVKFKYKYPEILIINPKTIGRYYSQDGQDVIVSSMLFKLLKNKENKFIIDIGCNHPTKFSNSYFFEQHFQCKTIAIDPIAKFHELWKSKRPSAIFIPTALGKIIGSVTLNIPAENSNYDDMFSTITGSNPKVGKIKWESRTVPCTTLNAILEEHNIKEVLIASIDVEGAEMDVLQGIDFEEIKIDCLIIENNTNDLYGEDAIRSYLNKKSYKFISRIGFLDDIFLHSSAIEKLK